MEPFRKERLWWRQGLCRHSNRLPTFLFRLGRDRNSAAVREKTPWLVYFLAGGAMRRSSSVKLKKKVILSSWAAAWA